MENLYHLKEIILDSNKQALVSIKNSEYKLAKEHLDRCLGLLRSKNLFESNKLLSITLNNLGCFYKRQGELDKALECFNNALKSSHETDLSVSEIYLNLSNIYSQNSDHYTALLNAFKALKSLKEKNSKTAALTFQCIAKEYEFLAMKKEAKHYYSKGLAICTGILKKNHHLTVEIQNSLNKMNNEVMSRRNSPFIAKTAQKQYNFKKSITPEIVITDRQLTDFISAPVSFEEIIKATVYSPYSKNISSNRSIGPVSRDLKSHRIRKENEHRLTPKPRIIKNHQSKQIKNKKLAMERLMPVPKRSKLSLSTERLKKVTNNLYI